MDFSKTVIWSATKKNQTMIVKVINYPVNLFYSFTFIFFCIRDVFRGSNS
jgi:hypothetical protein